MRARAAGEKPFEMSSTHIWQQRVFSYTNKKKLTKTNTPKTYGRHELKKKRKTGERPKALNLYPSPLWGGGGTHPASDEIKTKN